MMDMPSKVSKTALAFCVLGLFAALDIYSHVPDEFRNPPTLYCITFGSAIGFWMVGTFIHWSIVRIIRISK